MKAILRFFWPIDQLEQRIATLQIQADADQRYISDLIAENVGLHQRANEAVEVANRLQVELDRSKSDELTSAARLEAYEREAKKLRSEKDEAYRAAGLSLKQTETYRDAIVMLLEREAISATEVAQLNLGTYIPGDKATGLKPSIRFEDNTEGKASVDFGMKAQATEAKYRQIKGHFQVYQAAVSKMLDALNTMGKSNVITKEDIRKLQELRVNLGHQIQRSI